MVSVGGRLHSAVSLSLYHVACVSRRGKLLDAPHGWVGLEVAVHGVLPVAACQLVVHVLNLPVVM